MTTHLTDAELRDFVAGTASAEDLLRADDHVSGCDLCRTRALAGAGHSIARFDDLVAQLHPLSDHLSDEELQALVDGTLQPGARTAAQEHLASCSTCAAQMADLRSWAAASSAPPRRALVWALAAAVALAVLVPAVIWKTRTTSQAALPPGFAALGAAEQEQVRAALARGAAMLPDFMADLEASREVLMGPGAAERDAFTLVAPAGTATLSDRPQFEWQGAARADSYVVAVFDARGTEIARSPTLTEARWIPAEALDRERSYVWQVTARRGHETVTAPAAPMPPARFRIVDVQTADTLQRLQREHPDAHLVLGILDMEAGIVDAAARQLRQVPSNDPSFDVAQRSLARLPSRR